MLNYEFRIRKVEIEKKIILKYNSSNNHNQNQKKRKYYDY